MEHSAYTTMNWIALLIDYSVMVFGGVSISMIVAWMVIEKVVKNTKTGRWVWGACVQQHKRDRDDLAG